MAGDNGIEWLGVEYCSTSALNGRLSGELGGVLLLHTGKELQLSELTPSH
jgi:hypothetical protein